ncbi:unnamed protein product [Cylicocyclus nassatus]|uniref:Uncharacterized protein n=1 Tax=Cylicocyclus nassatus TaxID=53992 RepID=A0AA36DKQ0_CYLNA|nr:unnamed protein product [Cylicocyclus nassatus]
MCRAAVLNKAKRHIKNDKSFALANGRMLRDSCIGRTMSSLYSSAVDPLADENAVAVSVLASRSVYFVVSSVNDEVSCCSVADEITLLFWLLRSLVIRYPLQSSIERKCTFLVDRYGRYFGG